MLNLRLMDYLHGVYLVEMELKPSSVRQMEISIRLFSKWLGRSATLADLEPDVVSRWLQDYRQAQSATTAMNKRRQVLTLWHHGYVAWHKRLYAD